MSPRLVDASPTQLVIDRGTRCPDRAQALLHIPLPLRGRRHFQATIPRVALADSLHPWLHPLAPLGPRDAVGPELPEHWELTSTGSSNG